MNSYYRVGNQFCLIKENALLIKLQSVIELYYFLETYIELFSLTICYHQDSRCTLIEVHVILGNNYLIYGLIATKFLFLHHLDFSNVSMLQLLIESGQPDK